MDLAKQLGGALLTYNGTQHTVAFQGEKCVDEYVSDHLIDLRCRRRVQPAELPRFRDRGVTVGHRCVGGRRATMAAMESAGRVGTRMGSRTGPAVAVGLLVAALGAWPAAAAPAAARPRPLPWCGEL